MVRSARLPIPFVARGGASRQGLKRSVFATCLPGGFGVARGGASRQGLKHINKPTCTNAYPSGSWRGFPPGIETREGSAHEWRFDPVARGGASRQGLKPMKAVFTVRSLWSGSWRGFPPGIETCVTAASRTERKAWLVEGLPARD